MDWAPTAHWRHFLPEDAALGLWSGAHDFGVCADLPEVFSGAPTRQLTMAEGGGDEGSFFAKRGHHVCCPLPGNMLFQCIRARV